MLKDQPSAAAETTTHASDDRPLRRLLVCAACGRPITTTSARIEVAGSHTHTKVNPHGFVFEIGCFSQAVGCLTVGAPSPEWSWFAGYLWTMEVCARCLAHLGWRFQSEGHTFHGFVLDRLVEQDEDAGHP